MAISTQLTTTQTIRHGRIVGQTHTAILCDQIGSENPPALIERPTLNALQKAVEAAGGKFERKAVMLVRNRIED